MNTAYVLLRSGYADWEPASALAELRRTFGFSVTTMGLTAETIVSMGGLRVIPDLTLSEFEPESADILILPGGDSWTSGEVPEVSKAARTIFASSSSVGDTRLELSRRRAQPNRLAAASSAKRYGVLGALDRLFWGRLARVLRG